MRRFVENWLVIGLFLLAWELAPRFGLIDVFFISRPTLIVDRILDWLTSGELAINFLATFEEAILGFVIGAALGVAIGLWCGLNRHVARALMPVLTAGNALPKLAFVPLLVTWFGFGLASKVVLAAAVVFFFVFFGVYSGVIASDPLLLSNARVMGGRGFDMIRHVYLPSTLSWLLASLRLGIAYAFAAAVVGEYFGASQGLGYLINYGKSMMDLTDVFAGLTIVTGIVVVLDIGLGRLGTFGSRWRERSTSTEVRT